MYRRLGGRQNRSCILFHNFIVRNHPYGDFKVRQSTLVEHTAESADHFPVSETRRKNGECLRVRVKQRVASPNKKQK
jgi:hypothetical protein